MELGGWDEVVAFVEQAVSGKAMVPPAAVDIAGPGR